MKIKASIAVFSLFLAFSAPVKAQDCGVVAEALVTLKPPLFNTPSIWNGFYGQDGMEQISDVALGEDGTFIVVGAYTKDKDDTVYKPFLAKIDARGRALWEKRQESGKDKTIETILKRDDGYAILGNIRSKSGNGFYMAFYNEDGTKLREYPVFEKGYTLSALSFAPSQTGKSYVISAARTKSGEEGAKAVLYKITTGGKKLWRRQYSPGSSTQFNHVELAGDGHYTLVGEIEQDNGRMAGWITRVDDKGALIWQKPYLRGRDASLSHAYTHKNGSIVTSGYVKGADVENVGAWVMKTAPDGTVLWQRFYQGRTDYRAPSLIGYDDGRIQVLIDGTKNEDSKEWDRNHVSILSLSPRGRLFDVESFSDGLGAQGAMMKSGHYGERVIVGSVQNVKPQEGEEMKVSPEFFDGWILAATGLDPYEDPCEGRY